MKAVLLSTRPKWCEKICHEIGTDRKGKPIYEKPIEVRKTKPSIPTPFKCHIYCTKGKPFIQKIRFGDIAISNTQISNNLYNGKVIGEFVCDWIAEYDCELYNDGSDEEIRTVWYDEDDGERYTEIIARTGNHPWLLRHACMSWDEFKAYMGEGEKTFYAWHISQLKIYDKPKELSEFYKVGAKSLEKLATDDELCSYCYRTGGGEYAMVVTPNGLDACEGRFCEEAYEEYLEQEFALTRPPESWMYVQELEERK